jgi:hypothetical protein
MFYVWSEMEVFEDVVPWLMARHFDVLIIER